MQQTAIENGIMKRQINQRNRQPQQRRRKYAEMTTVSVVQLLLVLTVVCENFLVVVHSASYAYIPGGLQTDAERNPNGYSWASAAVYDATDHSLMITGTTYGSALDEDGLIDPSSKSSGGPTSSNFVNPGTCFLAIAMMPQPLPNDTNTSDDRMEWIESQLITNLTADANSQRNKEFCSYILRQDTMIYFAGATNNDGHSTIERIIPKGMVVPRKYVGMIMEMDGQLAVSANSDPKLPVMGGHTMTEYRTTFPQSIFYRPGDTNAYIASLVSDTASLEFEPNMDPFESLRANVGNYSWSSHIRQIKRKSKDSIEPFTMTTPVQNTYTDGWGFPLSSTHNIFVTGITEVNDDVIVVGYTSGGIGEALGAVNADLVDPSFDGFVTKLNTVTGTFKQVEGTSTSSVRIRSPDERDDIIAGLCIESTQSPDYMYIVGSTKGYLPPTSQSPGSDSDPNSMQAFISKLKIQTLELMWTIQIEADTASGKDAIVKGLNCAVSPNGDDVWIGGNVGSGNVISDAKNVQKSYGGLDIFVAKLATKDGSIDFQIQIGSSGDDTMAIQNGLLTDSGGNAIVVGTTTGSLFRKRDVSEPDSSNVFVMTIDATDGTFAKLVEDDDDAGDTPVAAPIADDVPVPVPVSAPVPAPETSTDGQDNNEDSGLPDDGLKGGSSSVSAPAPEEPSSSVTTSKEASNGHSQRWNMLVATLCILLFVVVAAVSYTNHRLSYREVSTDRGKVLSYMGAFEVEDIDLKHSATGGWHCSYTGDLALGKNRREYYTDDLNVGNGGLYRYNGSSSLLGGSNSGNGFVDADGEFDPLEPNVGGAGAQRLLDRTSAEYGGGFELYKNGDDATVRSGRTSVRGESLYSDDDDVSASSTTSGNRRSASHSNVISGSNYNDGYEDLINSNDTTWDQQPNDRQVKRRNRSENDDSAFDSSLSSLHDVKNSGSVWGKDIV